MVRVIAEVGVNHDGSLEKALELTSVAASCGADVIKFQTFSAELIVTKEAEKAAYQEQNTTPGSQYEMLKDLELSFEDHFILKQFAEKLGLQFLSTPFDLSSLNFLADDLRLETVKISSGDITNFPLLFNAGKKFSSIILSTGASTLAEVESAINVVSKGRKSNSSFESANQKSSIIVLHCTSEYPAPYSEINLKAINTLKSNFGVEVGYSDHTIGNQASIMAVTLGAAVLEKHITLDTKSPGPDHASSLGPEDFRQFVESIRRAESMLGDGLKNASKSESLNVPKIRRGLYASNFVKKGEIFTESNIISLRPEGTFSASRYFDVFGTRAVRDFQEGEQLEI